MQHIIGNRVLQMILVCLASQDRDAVLEVGKLDVRDHSPLETGNEARFNAGDFTRWPVAGEDDLPAALVERIEGVKEFFLCRFLSLEEVDVIDEQEIEFAETTPVIVRRSRLNRHHVLIR